MHQHISWVGPHENVVLKVARGTKQPHLIMKGWLMNLSSRAGIDHLGKYLCSSPRWARAQEWLSSNVTEAAIDYGLLKVLAHIDVELDKDKDNRSVTSPEWIQTGLFKFGCPVHGAKRGVSPSEFSYDVSGLGPCSCGGRESKSGPIPLQGRGSRRSRDTRKGISFPNRSGSQSEASPLQWLQTKAKAEASSAIQSAFGTRVSGNLGFQWPESSDPSGIGTPDRSEPVLQREVLSSRGSGNNLQGVDNSWRPEVYADAVSAAFHVAGNREGRHVVLSVDEVVENHIRRNKYSGAPFFGSNRDHLVSGARRAQRLIDHESGFDPYLVGRRVQPGSSGPKTRLVWMAPLATTIVATRFSKPCYKGLVRKRPFAWGLHNCDKVALVEGFRSRYRYVYSLDYSGFDTSIPAHMIDDAFGLLSTYLDMTDDELELFRRIQNDFIHSQLLTPDGEMYQVHKGIPSGNPFTSLIGSVVNLILVQYMWLRITGNIMSDHNVLILGDDVVFASDTFVPLGKLSSAAAELGFTLSVEKSAVAHSYREEDDDEETGDSYDNMVHFLGHYWMKGRARRPMKEILQRQIFPERHKKRSMQESLLRLYSYIPDSYEGYKLFRTVYGNPDILGAIREALGDIGTEVELATFDLPGRLRLLFDVEDDTFDEPFSGSGPALAIIGPVA